MKGMLVSVLRSAVDCTNGGITSKHSQFVLVGPGIPELIEASDRCPALICKSWYGHFKAEPVKSDPKLIGPMFGGNFVWTSDSRFPGGHPIKVHDRFETQAQYDANFD